MYSHYETHSRCFKFDMIEIVKYLLSNGADVNAKSVGGSTPLHIAAEVTVESCDNLKSKTIYKRTSKW